MQETRYRRRYLDGIVNPFVRDNFVTRAAIIRYIRRFFDDRDFLEVQSLSHSVLKICSAAKLATHAAGCWSYSPH